MLRFIVVLGLLAATAAADVDDTSSCAVDEVDASISADRLLQTKVARRSPGSLADPAELVEEELTKPMSLASGDDSVLQLDEKLQPAPKRFQERAKKHGWAMNRENSCGTNIKHSEKACGKVKKAGRIDIDTKCPKTKDDCCKCDGCQWVKKRGCCMDSAGTGLDLTCPLEHLNSCGNDDRSSVGKCKNIKDKNELGCPRLKGDCCKCLGCKWSENDGKGVCYEDKSSAAGFEVALMDGTKLVEKFMAADIADAKENAVDIIKEKKLLVVGDKCDLCEDHLEPECCLVWTQGGSYKPHEEELEQGRSAMLHVKLKSEKGMNQDLADFVNNLPTDATEKTGLFEELREKGIYKLAQLAGIDPEEVAGNLTKFKGVVESFFTEEAGVQEGKAEKEETEEEKAKRIEKAEKLMEKARNMTQAVKAEAQTLSSDALQANRAAATSGLGRVTARSQALEADVMNKLGQLKLRAATLNTDIATKAVEQALTSQFHDSGGELNAKQLIYHNGLLRGVSLTGQSLSSIMLRPVLQLTPAAELKGQQALKMETVMNPDLEVKESTLESTSATDMQEANKVIESYGMSAFQASQSNTGVSGSVSAPGVGSANIGVSVGSEESSGGSNRGSDTTTNQMKEETSSYIKTRYYFEPRAMVVVDPLLLGPTPAFKRAIRSVQANMKKAGLTSIGNTTDETLSIVPNYGVTDLVREFGTHVCLRAMLGGWWRLIANYQSASTMRTVDMAKSATAAIESSSGSTVGVSGGVAATHPTNGASGAASVGTSSGSSESESEEFTQGTKSLSNGADSNSVLDVTQEWKGGASGGTPKEWRESLVPAKSSNWKVIDRYADSCDGIWRWIDDPKLKKLVCEQWRNALLEESDLEMASAELESACVATGAKEFRKIIARHLDAKAKAQLKAEKDNCATTAGMYWDDKQEKCKAKVCTCQGGPGVVGHGCPENGAEKCSTGQLAECNTIVCPTGYVPKDGASSKKCASKFCDPSADRDQCCQDKRLSNAFTLKIRTKSGGGCGTNEAVYAKLYGDGGSTGWRLMDTSGYDDFEQGDVKDYPIYSTRRRNGPKFIPTMLCLESDGWCVQNKAVTVYNKNLGKSKGKIGDVYGFKGFYGSSQCKSISTR